MSGVEERLTSKYNISNDSWYSDFADKLLSENFLLTALEFYAELIESGKDLPKLKNFFSNPLNFEHQALNRSEGLQSPNLPRSSSQATLDSLDLTRYSEDGERSVEDRVAVLEFELRKAKETINALRINLTEVAELESNKVKSQEKTMKESQTPHLKSSPFSIKPHEQRALNFLINEYLLLHGYKLTSITFADENENQDFDDWDDVGLNSARPLELLYLYRDGLKGTKCFVGPSMQDFECQVTLFDEVKHDLQIKELKSEILHLSNELTVKTAEYSNIIKKLENKNSMIVHLQETLTLEPDFCEMIKTPELCETSETINDFNNLISSKIEKKTKGKEESIDDLKTNDHLNFEITSNSNIGKNLPQKFCNKDILIEHETKENNETEGFVDQNLQFSKFDQDIKKDNMLEITETDIKKVNNEEGEIRDENDRNKNVIYGLDIKNLRPIPDKFKNEILNHCSAFLPVSNGREVLNSWIKKEVLERDNNESIIELLSKSLPKIIPNIILNKREEIVPLLVLCICLNPCLTERDKLLNLLFNLKKKPQFEDRSYILQSLINIAQIKGSITVENEILPQCWEQLGHKYVERRMLAAESCFLLSPYVSEAIRNSLILSIAQQLVQDREETVRKAAINILALLIALVSHEEKYNQISEICFQILNDESGEVNALVLKLLFPTLAQWSFSLKKIQSDLYAKLLMKIKVEKSLNFIRVVELLLPYLLMTVACTERLLEMSVNDYTPSTKRQEFSHLCKNLCDPNLFCEKPLEKIMEAFDYYVLQTDINVSDWPELNWVKNIFVPDLLEAGNNHCEDEGVLQALASALRYLCLGLGKTVTSLLIKPFFLEKLMDCENSVVSGKDYKCAIIPLYLVGVLSTFPEELQEMSNTLRRFICALPLCGVSLLPLKITFEILSRYQTWQILILDAIWEGVVHQRPLVRCGSSSLLEHVIPNIPEILINTKILPALVTLTSDPEPTVKASAIPSLGMLVNTREKTIHDKVLLTFQTLLQESIAAGNNSLLIHLLKTIGSVYENTDNRFREEIVLPQLSSISAMAFQTKSKDLIEVLIDVYSIITFSQIHIPPQCASSYLLSGLRYIDSLCNQFHSPQSERICSIIKDVERRFGAVNNESSKSSKSPSDGKKFVKNVVSSNLVVEDMRNRVNKILNAKPNTLHNVSGIFKKKS